MYLLILFIPIPAITPFRIPRGSYTINPETDPIIGTVIASKAGNADMRAVLMASDKTAVFATANPTTTVFPISAIRILSGVS